LNLFRDVGRGDQGISRWTNEQQGEKQARHFPTV
jgi:hypothetical protein